MAGGIQNPQLRGGQRSTQGNALPVGPGALKIEPGHLHRGLGGAVGVDQSRLGWSDRLPDPQVLNDELFTAHDHQPQTVRNGQIRSPAFLDQIGPEGGRQTHHRDPVPFQEAEEMGGRAEHVLRATDHRSPSGQGRKNLLNAGIKREGGKLQHPIALVELVALHHLSRKHFQG